MSRLGLVAAFALAVSFAGGVSLGAEPFGWRGDGTGIVQDAKPPIHWGQTSKAMGALRHQAAPPTSDAPAGQTMSDGVIREWMILGPLPTEQEEGGYTKDALLADDLSKLMPKAGDKLGDAQWQVYKPDTAYLDFARQFDTYGKDKSDLAAYGVTHLYSPVEAAFVVQIHNSASIRLWVNGKALPKIKGDADMSYYPQTIKLSKGWNQFVLRSTPGNGEQRVGVRWYVNLNFRAALRNSEMEAKNIKWRALMPCGEGYGQPVVAGGKIFLLSEPADLVCIDEATGKILWVRSNNYDELATKEEFAANADAFKEIGDLQAKLRAVNDSFAKDNPPKLEALGGSEGYKEKITLQNALYRAMRQINDEKYKLPGGQDVGFAGVTPVTDGKHVWAWFITGVTCCYDMDGKLVWRRLDNEGSFFEHGHSVSPILADGKLIVCMKNITAYDAKTGERVWSVGRPDLAASRFFGTPGVALAGDTKLVVLPTGHMLRLSDGKLVRGKGPDVSNRQFEIPSTVVMGKTIFELSTFCSLRKVTMPAQFADPLVPADIKTVALDMSKFPYYYMHWHMSSPVIVEGLAYCLNNSGVLSVVDTETMEVVYQKLVDIDHFQSTGDGAGRGVGVSPVAAGGYVYLLGNSGSTLIIKPGRTYQEVAKNRIESLIPRNYTVKNERFVANPVIDGKSLFIRGEKYLYCVQE